MAADETYRDERSWVVIPMDERHFGTVRQLWRKRFGSKSEHIDGWLSDVPNENRPTEGFVAVSGGSVLGFGIATAAAPEWVDGYLNHDGIDVDVWPTTGVVHMVCVAKRHESRGIATALVDQQLRYLTANGVGGIVAVSWHREDYRDSRPLFEKFDFEPAVVSEHFYSEVADTEDVPCVDCEGTCDCGATIYKRPLAGDGDE